MHIAVISVGKKHAPEFVAAIEQYSSRITRFAKFEWVILPESGIGLAGITKESDLVRSKLLPRDSLVVLDETGQQFTSAKVNSQILQAVPPGNRLVFVIGGAYGVDDALKKQASALWCLGQLTFPHQLVRLILAEQLYRAFAIANNLPYHHA